jgi:spermidine/putrescine transport system permease protein
MIGNAIQSLFGRQSDAPLGAAVSVIMMIAVTLLVCLFLWGVGYRTMRSRSGA